MGLLTKLYETKQRASGDLLGDWQKDLEDLCALFGDATLPIVLATRKFLYEKDSLKQSRFFKDLAVILRTTDTLTTDEQQKQQLDKVFDVFSAMYVHVPASPSHRRHFLALFQANERCQAITTEKFTGLITEFVTSDVSASEHQRQLEVVLHMTEFPLGDRVVGTRLADIIAYLHHRLVTVSAQLHASRDVVTECPDLLLQCMTICKIILAVLRTHAPLLATLFSLHTDDLTRALDSTSSAPLSLATLHIREPPSLLMHLFTQLLQLSSSPLLIKEASYLSCMVIVSLISHVQPENPAPLLEKYVSASTDSPLRMLSRIKACLTCAPLTPVHPSIPSASSQRDAFRSFLFQTLFLSCQHEQHPIPRLLAFQSIALFFSMTAEKDSTIVMPSPSRECLDQTLDLLLSCWDDPVDGVSQQCQQTFVLLLTHYDALFRIHSESTKAHSHTFFHSLLHRLLDQHLHQSMDYSPLKALLQRIQIVPFLTHERPALLSDLVVTMQNPMLTGHAADFYLAIGTTLLEQKEKEESLPCDALYGEWISHLLKCLSSPLDHVVKATTTHILRPHTKMHGAALIATLLSMASSTAHLQASLVLHQFAKRETSLPVSLSPEMIERCLCHPNPTLRADTLFFLADEKTAVPVDRCQRMAVQRCLIASLKTAHAERRQTLVMALSRFLTRLRDHIYHVVIKGHVKDGDSEETLEVYRDFLQAVLHALSTSLCPGMAYHRTALVTELLSAHSALMLDPQQCSTTELSPPPPLPTGYTTSFHLMEDPQKAMQQRQMRFPVRLRLSFPAHVVVSLIETLMDGYDRHRALARDMLCQFVPSPMKGAQRALLLWALVIVRSSARAADSEGAAMVCQTIVQTCMIQDNWRWDGQWPILEQRLNTLYSDAALQRLNERRQHWNLYAGHYQPQNVDDRTLSSPLLFGYQLWEMLKVHVMKATSEKEQSVQRYPLHGLLLCLRQTVMAVPAIMIEQDVAWQRFIVSLLVYLQTELHTAILHLQHCSLPDNEQGEEEVKEEEEEEEIETEDAENEASPSSERHLRATYGWRAMKEQSLLIGCLLTQRTRYTSNDIALSNDAYTLLCDQTGRFLIDTLLSVRHWGTVSAYADTLRDVATQWLPLQREMVHAWMTSVLAPLQGDSDAIKRSMTATRRSAGWPFAVVALLTAESTRVQKPMLSLAMARLFDAATEHRHPDGDIMRVHAMNILRAVFRNAKLGPDVLAYVAQGIQLSIRGFQHHNWAIRNCATMLLSSLVSRVFGVKRVKDDYSPLNTLTAKEFFSRFPALYAFLLDVLGQMTASLSSLPPGLYPLLTLLSRLAPCEDVSQASFSTAAFLPLLDRCRASPVWKVREASARALASLLSLHHVVPFYTHVSQRVLQEIRSRQWNRAHGSILQMHALVTVRHIKQPLLNTAEMLSLLLLDRPQLCLSSQIVLERYLSLMVGPFADFSLLPRMSSQDTMRITYPPLAAVCADYQIRCEPSLAVLLTQHTLYEVRMKALSYCTCCDTLRVALNDAHEPCRRLALERLREITAVCASLSDAHTAVKDLSIETQAAQLYAQCSDDAEDGVREDALAALQTLQWSSSMPLNAYRALLRLLQDREEALRDGAAVIAGAWLGKDGPLDLLHAQQQIYETLNADYGDRKALWHCYADILHVETTDVLVNDLHQSRGRVFYNESINPFRETLLSLQLALYYGHQLISGMTKEQVNEWILKDASVTSCVTHLKRMADIAALCQEEIPFNVLGYGGFKADTFMTCYRIIAQCLLLAWAWKRVGMDVDDHHEIIVALRILAGCRLHPVLANLLFRVGASGMSLVSVLDRSEGLAYAYTELLFDDSSMVSNLFLILPSFNKE